MRSTYALVAAVLVIAGCGGSAPEVGAPASTTTVAVTTTTTVAPATTVATTTAPPTTVAEVPTTTTAPAADVEAQVRQAILDQYDAHSRCFADVATCDPNQFARGQHLVNELDLLAKAREGDWILKPREDDPWYAVVRSVMVAADGQTARADGCVWDSSIMYGSGGVSIVNDVNYSDDSIWELVNENGVWFVSRNSATTRAESVNKCER